MTNSKDDVYTVFTQFSVQKTPRNVLIRRQNCKWYLLIPLSLVLLQLVLTHAHPKATLHVK